MDGDNPQAFVTRVSEVTPSVGFTVRLQAEEAIGVPGPEQVAWFAINRSTSGRMLADTQDGVTHEHDTGMVEFPNDMGITPSFFAQMQTMNGGDTAGLRALMLD